MEEVERQSVQGGEKSKWRMSFSSDPIQKGGINKALKHKTRSIIMAQQSININSFPHQNNKS